MRRILKSLSRGGFTLIELLIALLIFSVVAVAVYSTFRTGIGAWRKIENNISSYQEARVILDRVALDLRNAIRFSEIGFIGGMNSLSFPVVLDTTGPEGLIHPQIYKVSYYLGEANETSTIKPLLRKEETFSKSLQEGSTVEPDELASSVTRLDLGYYYQSSGEETGYKWKGTWDASAIPKGIRIVLALEGGERSEGEITLTKTIFIPTGTEGVEE